MSLKKRLKKLVSVLATFMLVTRIRGKEVEIAEASKIAKGIETVEAGKNGKESKDGENPRSNFV